ncbi:MAG: CynX/NimT family MFS transporter [Chromatocurvus sp.]
MPSHNPEKSAEKPKPPALQKWLILLGVLAVALNLRPALTSIAPLLGDIQQVTGLSPGIAGLLTTAPVLCLGIFGPLAPWLAGRIGSERTIGLFLVVLGAGCVVRATTVPLGLFIGTLMAGAGIGVVGVLLPAVLKREFPDYAARLTGVYTLLLCLGAAAAAGLTVPVAAHFDNSWRAGLTVWCLPALLALLVWSPQMRRKSQPAAAGAPPTAIWKDRVAWQVTLFMGLQSSLAYCVFGWLPFILQTRGVSVSDSGVTMSVSIGAQLLTALGGPFIATAFRDQRPAVLLFMGLTLAGLLSIVYLPLCKVTLWAIVLGLGQGGTFSVALSLIVLRARDATMTGRLSGMAQSVGYTLAATGPLMVGTFYGWYGNWNAVAVMFCVIALVGTLAGLGAGRRRFVGE